MDTHLAHCRACADYYADLRRVQTDLRSTLTTKLGQPTPPPHLRRKTRQMLRVPTRPAQTRWWLITQHALNGVAVVIFLSLFASGWWLINRPPPQATTVAQNLTVLPSPTLDQLISAVETVEPLLPLTDTTVITPTPVRETLPLPRAKTPTPEAVIAAVKPPRQTLTPTLTSVLTKATRIFNSTPSIQRPAPPSGLIAFPAFDTSHYQTYLLDVETGEVTRFPLAVSEPALTRKDGVTRLAYRGWGDPSRRLLTSNLGGEIPDQVDDYWEDAQPDWSPTEYRLIFASQREQDRKWGLHTAWGDGSHRRELVHLGHSPTFAPDGDRFAYINCIVLEGGAEECGLWQSKLHQNQQAAQPIIADLPAHAPDWSPTDEQIAYMAEVDGNWDIYLTDSMGTTPRQLTDSPAIDGLPTWSPDGAWLAFLSDRGGWGIWLLHPASNTLRQAHAFEAHLTFSPPHTPPFSFDDHDSSPRTWSDEQLSWID